MKKRWLTAIIMAALLLVQAVAVCGGALAEDEEHVHEWSAWESKGTCHERHCTAEGCDGVEKASHDVPCTICGYGVQPEHTHEWSAWESKGTYHERHCTAEGCDAEEKFDHELVDGRCDKCGYTMHGAKNEWKYDETKHWHECLFEGCTEKFAEKDHVIIGGKCKCGYEKKHDYSDEWSYDEVDHWHACTEEGCNWTNDQAEHEWSEWEGHGTYHERHCTVCQKTEQEKHELPDGKCDICGYTMHGAKNEWKYDETNHWHECLFEGCTEKFGEEAHTLVNGKCACGYEKKQEEKPAEPSYDYDNEYVAPAPLPPQTGDASRLAAGIGMIAAAVCIALRKKQSN